MRTKTGSPELYGLTKPINPRFIEKPPAGKYGSYVPHFVISQIILATVGPYDWRLVEILRGRVPAFTTSKGVDYPELENAVVGCIYRMTLQIDGREVTIEETGSADQEAFDDNDGERLKKASSDALKRCAMRLGVGIHLWCKRDDQFFVHKSLDFFDDSTTDDEHEDAVVGVEEAEVEADG